VWGSARVAREPPFGSVASISFDLVFTAARRIAD
jgi:hypothetical protein